MPGRHAIFLTDASDAVFPGCVSGPFGKIKCRSSGGMNGTKKMIPLCMVSASFLFETFFASEHFVNFSFDFDFCSGQQITLSEVNVIDCEDQLIVVGFVIFHQIQFCSKPLRGVSALLLCTSTQS